jgi:hypothetical protein
MTGIEAIKAFLREDPFGPRTILTPRQYRMLWWTPGWP